MKKLTGLISIFLMLFFAGCSDSDNREYQYRISVLNLTNNQPIMPIAVIIHNNDYDAWEVGEAASTALEKLAEGGSTEDLIASADGSGQVYFTDTFGSSDFAPGTAESMDVTFTTHKNNPLKLTLAGKMRSTNDGFAGRKTIDLSQLSLTETREMSVDLLAYDSGTEENTETDATILDASANSESSEGFNASRTGDVDRVSLHIGVIGNQGGAKLGLSTSSLTSNQRFDNPVARVYITRLR